MKYAKEVIDLLACYPKRRFRVGEIVKHVSLGRDLSSPEKSSIRKAVARVLAAMEEGGSLRVTESLTGIGGYHLYSLRQVGDVESELDEMSAQGVADIRRWAHSAGVPDPVRSYRTHEKRARARGIEFLMTFKEWWGVWEGKYEQRGPSGDSLCMGRFGDTGPYAIGNVYITSHHGNMVDYHASEKKQVDIVARKQLKAAGIERLIETVRVERELYDYVPTEQLEARLRLGLPIRHAKVGHDG